MYRLQYDKFTSTVFLFFCSVLDVVHENEHVISKYRWIFCFFVSVFAEASFGRIFLDF